MCADILHAVACDCVALFHVAARVARANSGLRTRIQLTSAAR